MWLVGIVLLVHVSLLLGLSGALDFQLPDQASTPVSPLQTRMIAAPPPPAARALPPPAARATPPPVAVRPPPQDEKAEIDIPFFAGSLCDDWKKGRLFGPLSLTLWPVDPDSLPGSLPAPWPAQRRPRS